MQKLQDPYKWCRYLCTRTAPWVEVYSLQRAAIRGKDREERARTSCSLVNGEWTAFTGLICMCQLFQNQRHLKSFEMNSQGFTHS